MTTAQKHDIEVDQGATFTLTLTYKDSAGAALDLSGYGARMQIRDGVGGKVYGSADTAGGRITTDASGQIAVSIPHTETAKMDIKRAVYDLFIWPAAGAPVDKLLYGDVDIIPSVSR